VKHAETGQILHEHLVPSDLAAEVLADGHARGMTQNYYHADGGLYVRERTRWTDLYQSRTGSDLVVFGDLMRLAGGSPQKIIWVTAPEQVATLFPEMEARYAGRLYVTVTDPEYLEFMTLGVNKAVGVAAVARHYGIEPAQVLAFGDGNNDVPMLQWAGLGVAMSDGRPSAKAAAALIAPPGDPETSLARAIAAVLDGNSSIQRGV
jgi:hydroxymethylpyrimidine pyrophosphatase-like HAD family hydrolase